MQKAGYGCTTPLLPARDNDRMHTIQKVIQGYRQLERPILYAIAAQFCIQAVHTSAFLLLNYFMDKEGYADYAIARVLSYRYLAVFALAFPVGLFIKGRRLIPFFYAASVAVPVITHLLLLAIDRHWEQWIPTLAMAWGLAYMAMQVTILPFILLNGKKETHSEAFSLSFLTFSGTIFVVGILNSLLHSIDPAFFTEKRVLQAVATFSLLSLFFVSRIRIREELSYRVPLRQIRRDYDWGLIIRAFIPTLIIAIGAGFTIPVINLFFLNVHGVSSQLFSMLGATTYGLVAVVMLFMPYIKRSFGYRTAITLFQSMAVLALFFLATTEYYNELSFALPVAIFFYIIRQPLMNAAGPMTSELIMYYVGKRNQEIMSALQASIWAGSWFVSMKLFAWLRAMNYRYVTIFLITVGLYIIGVAWYAYIIRQYERRRALRRQEERAEAAV